MDPIRVMSVSTASISILKSRPPKLYVTADGKVPTLGWGKGLLLPWRYVVAPVDGIQDFDFVAPPPSGTVPTIVSPVHGEIEGEVDVGTYWGAGKPLQGVRVHARENSVEQLWPGPSVTASMVGDDPVVPWPW